MAATSSTLRLGALVFAACALAAAAKGTTSAALRDADAPKKPTLTLKATPMMSFTPAKIRFVAELKGGANDDEELYCPSVEWDWNDDTTSEASSDCEPYQPGKSVILRRFSTEHIYKLPGHYRVQIRLKKKSRVIISANVDIEVNPGVRDPGQG